MPTTESEKYSRSLLSLTLHTHFASEHHETRDKKFTSLLQCGRALCPFARTNPNRRRQELP